MTFADVPEWEEFYEVTRGQKVYFRKLPRCAWGGEYCGPCDDCQESHVWNAVNLYGKYLVHFCPNRGQVFQEAPWIKPQ